MEFPVRVEVHTVQINPPAVCAVVPSEHAIWIQHGDQLEDKVPTQQLRSRVICPEEKAKEAIEDVARRGFPWVDTAADKHNLREEGTVHT